jgi:hypothetical protein
MDIFNSPQISTVGKIFLAGITSAVLGKQSFLKIKGTPDEVDVIKQALKASRDLHDEIENPNATVQSIMSRLNIKNHAASEFQKVLNLPWPI